MADHFSSAKKSRKYIEKLNHSIPRSKECLEKLNYREGRRSQTERQLLAGTGRQRSDSNLQTRIGRNQPSPGENKKTTHRLN